MISINASFFVLYNQYKKFKQYQLFFAHWLFFIVLTYASWYTHPLFSLFSFVPYLGILCSEKRNVGYYLRLYAFNLTWNVIVTYWLCEVRLYKGLGALLINSLLFLIPVICWHFSVKYAKLKYGSTLVLLILWILFEYFHHIWDFSWTWLTIGNVFGANPHWVSWYAYLGVLGGSAWILLCNYSIYITIKRGGTITNLCKCCFIIFLPILTSGIISKLPDTNNVVERKFTLVGTAIPGDDPISDINKLRIIDTLLQQNSVTTSHITILPEDLISNDTWLNRFPTTDIYAFLKKSLHNWRTDNIITGTVLNVPNPEGQHIESRMGFNTAYSKYNAALMIDKSDMINIKLKKSYVPLEEYIPDYLSFLNVGSYKFSINPNNSDIFQINNYDYFICICYEAINSIFVASHLSDNTRAMLMLSSESFFGGAETGRIQFKNICRLRCIENNLPLLKSSNDGILFNVNKAGDIIEVKRVLSPTFLNTTVSLSTPSFYHLIVPYISQFLLSILFLIWLFNVTIKFKS
ncbi:hypothetical protein [Chitinophaga polysaccharea]|uniref:hypothetical protein n=1 Tax=Chitinophaga polysaccharea TaxID=1293035 RepID=UPI001158B757|nr:hypothetical protein [Chitinophaga polysaccharea]